MFSRKPTSTPKVNPTSIASAPSISKEGIDPPPPPAPNGAPTTLSRKRSQPLPISPVKRSKSSAASPGASAPGQKTLAGFFKPKPNSNSATPQLQPGISQTSTGTPNSTAAPSPSDNGSSKATPAPGESQPASSTESPAADLTPSKFGDDTVIDPIVSKQDWGKLFTKRPVPKCDGHQEPCISLTTKKPGMNRGRAFWICPRPLGPSGEKEKGTQWRCPTFIWSSDWNSSASTGS